VGGYGTLVALAASSILVVLVCVEIGLRVYTVLAEEAGLRDLESRREFASPLGAKASLGDIIRPSSRRAVVYELIPGVETLYKGQPLSVNEAGFRGRHYRKTKLPRTVRIVGLGDSVMFGSGVADDETYLARLADNLNERFSQVSWEVINTGVPGYNTTMEVAVLESTGLDYEPDLVLIGFVSNDFGLPNFILYREDPWTLTRS